MARSASLSSIIRNILDILLCWILAYEDIDEGDTVDVNAASLRVVTIAVKVHTLSGRIDYIYIDTLDVLSESINNIFQELFDINFPVYYAGSYKLRKTSFKEAYSIHAYGAAVDLNPYMNPYFDAKENRIIPTRCKDRNEDIEKMNEFFEEHDDVPEIDRRAYYENIIQPEGSDDWFLNRSLMRPGMVTSEVVEIFKKHGFIIWGGTWRQPMDYMHFQIPRDLAMKFIRFPYNVSKKIWNEYLKEQQSK